MNEFSIAMMFDAMMFDAMMFDCNDVRLQWFR